MKHARGLDWTWIPLSCLSLKLTYLVSKLAGYWSGGRRASMGVGCTWEISVPSAQFCFESETEVKGKFAQSCQTLHPQDCSLPGSSVHGILQARILAWVAVPFSRGFSQPRDQTQVSCITGRFFTIWATGKAQEYWSKLIPTPRDLSDPGIKSWSPALQAGSLPAELPGKPHGLSLELL